MRRRLPFRGPRRLGLLVLTLLPGLAVAEPVCSEAELWVATLGTDVTDYTVTDSHSLVCVQTYNGGKKTQFSFTTPNVKTGGADRTVSPVFSSSERGAHEIQSSTKYWVEKLNSKPAVFAFCSADAATAKRVSICAVIGMDAYRKAQAAKEEPLVPDQAPAPAPAPAAVNRAKTQDL
jgi:hypothetical protein